VLPLQILRGTRPPERVIGERFEITLRAHSRDCFIEGAVKAARWVHENKGRGKVFTMWDVLGIEWCCQL